MDLGTFIAGCASEMMVGSPREWGSEKKIALVVIARSKAITEDAIMKKLLALLLVPVLVLSLAACQSEEAPPPAEDTSAQAEAPPVETNEDSAAVAAVRAMSDEDFIMAYIYDLKVAMPDDFQFADASELSTPTLIRFFLFTLDTTNEAAYAQYEDDWLQDDGMFHIPITDVEAQLDRFLKGFSLKPLQLENYDAESGELVQTTITGFGGDVFPKLVAREYDGDVVTATVDFYTDSDLATKDYSKTFTFEFYDGGYYLLSVI